MLTLTFVSNKGPLVKALVSVSKVAKIEKTSLLVLVMRSYQVFLDFFLFTESSSRFCVCGCDPC